MATPPQTMPDDAPPEKASDDDSLLDTDVIAQLRSMDASGEDRIFRKVAGVFLDTTPEQLDKLKTHLADGDASGIALIAHSLKTGAANVAAMSLSRSFRELEMSAREEDLAACATLAEEIFDLFSKVSAALTDFIDDGQNIRESA